MGLPLLVMSCAGVGYAFWRRERGDIILLAFTVIGYGVTSMSAVRFARYLMPLLPALCVLAARITLSRQWSGVSARVGLGVAALVAAACAVISVCLVRAMLAPDPRDRAADYLAAQAPPRSSVAFAHIPWYYSPPLSPLWGALRSDVRARGESDPPVFEFRMPAGDWDPTVLRPMPNYIVLSNIELAAEYRRLRLPAAVTWIDSLPSDAARTVFAPPGVPGMAPNDMNLPQDLLYVLPEITVIQPRRQMVALHRQ